MTYKLTNNTKGNVSVAGISWIKGETKTLSFVNKEIINAVEVTKILLSDTDLTPLGSALAAQTSTPSVTAVTGAAVAPATGVLAIAAITDVATAAAAVKTVAAEMTRQNADITALFARLVAIEQVLARHDDQLLRSTSS